MEDSTRFFECARCRVQVVICSRCDRGQIYCSSDCSQIIRRTCVNEAGRRYQRSRRGRFAHADRSRRYRERQKVTHQALPATIPDDSLPADSAVAASWQLSHAESSTLRKADCHFCGGRRQNPCGPATNSIDALDSSTSAEELTVAISPELEAKMTRPTETAGLPSTIPFAIPADWNAEQALAVVELLDDLRERIWAHYQVPLFELIREQRRPPAAPDTADTDLNHPPF